MPFLEKDFDAYTSRLHLSDPTKTYLREARKGLSRSVGTTGFPSVVVEYPSRKMGTSIVAESRSGEMAFAVLCEYDPKVVAFYEQPPQVEVFRQDRRGRRVLRPHHPDFLVLHVDGPFVVEVKPQDKLEDNVKRSPIDWTFDGEHFHDGPAELALGVIGLSHRVVSTESMPSIRINNLQTLLHVRTYSDGNAPRLGIEDLTKAFRTTAISTLASIAEVLKLSSYEPLLQLIDEGVLHCDLDRELLTEVTSCRTTLLPDLLDDPSHCNSQTPASASVLHCPPLVQARRALENLQRLQDGTLPKRTARRLNSAIRECLATGGTRFLAVTPRTFNSGNRQWKRPAFLIEHALEFIRTNYASAKRPSVASTYRAYRVASQERFPGTQPLSKPTFTVRVRELSKETASGRGGVRMANAASAPTDVTTRVQVPQRPFELATCDHFNVDLELVVLRTESRSYTAKPWLTVLKDVATGLVLSIWISFRPPSRIACATLLRCCARVHGRLPEGIVVDRGSDFQSTYFAALLASHGIKHVSRPSSHPRFGSEAERFYGEFSSLWLPQRPGNSADPVRARAISGSHSAASTAQIDLETFLQECLNFCDWGRSNVAPRNADSPGKLFADGMVRFPSSGIPVVYDDTFLIATAVDDTRIKLDPARGLHVGASHYWHPRLASPNLRRSKLEVRRDPEDSSTVYARVENDWITCKDSTHPVQRSRSYAIRVANSLVAAEMAAVRQKAKDDADRNLTERLRDSDARLLQLGGARPSATRKHDEWEDDDQIEVPQMSQWEPSHD
ncbi:DDE-type integrase/transposase/recombinase [Dokdonella sp. MW10]|uniref:DDE-type integrase/transposase/recombinase n=1 Tax=Dokdonella sp. MW10 TaxID=2992926 RepID=UPI003F7D625B